MLFEQSVWVVAIAQLVEVADSALLCGVFEVVSSSPTVGHIFQHLTDITDIYIKDSDRGLVPDRGPIPRSRANSTSRANTDRAIPQRGPILLSDENTISILSVFMGLDTIRRI